MIEYLTLLFCVFDQDSFFSVSVEDLAANQEAQNSVRHIMDSLCPAGGSVGTFGFIQLSLIKSVKVQSNRAQLRG